MLKPQRVPAVYQHGGQSQDYLEVRWQQNALVVLPDGKIHYQAYRTGS